MKETKEGRKSEVSFDGKMTKQPTEGQCLEMGIHLPVGA